MPPIIEAHALVKDYTLGKNVVHALRGVDFHVDAGELVAIMGPSGSGKSTLMNILGLLDRPESGEYRLNGEDVSVMDDRGLAECRNKQLGFIFQTFNLLPRSTALQNVMVPLEYSRESGTAAEKARVALKTVGLADRMRHRPSELSGGQQQRVAIARAIVNDPVLILGDEPTGNLDSRTSEDILAVLQDLNRAGKTVLIVTHEEDVARHCRRIVRFRDGKIVSDEPVTNQLDAREVLNSMPAQG